MEQKQKTLNQSSETQKHELDSEPRTKSRPNNLAQSLYLSLKSKDSIHNQDSVEVFELPNNSSVELALQAMHQIFLEKPHEENRKVFLVHIDKNEVQNSVETEEIKIQNNENSVEIQNSSLNPSLDEIHHHSIVLLNSGEKKLSEKLLRWGISQYPEKSVPLLLTLATLLEKDERYLEAISKLKERLAFCFDVKVALLLSRLQYRSGQFESSLLNCNRILSVQGLQNIEKASILALKAQVQNQLNQNLEAKETWKKAYELHSNEVRILKGYAQSLEHFREFEEAEKIYFKILEQTPNDLSIFKKLKRITDKEDFLKNYFKKCLKLNFEKRPNSDHSQWIEMAFDFKFYLEIENFLDLKMQNNSIEINELLTLVRVKISLNKISQAKTLTKTFLKHRPDHSGAKDILSKLNYIKETQ